VTPGKTLARASCSCATAIEDSGTRDKVKALAADVLEYVAQIDFDKYFDAQGRSGTGGGGKLNQEFVNFSASSVQAAQVRLVLVVESKQLLPALSSAGLDGTRQCLQLGVFTPAPGRDNAAVKSRSIFDFIVVTLAD